MGNGVISFGGSIAIFCMILFIILVFYRLVQLALNRSQIKKDIENLTKEIIDLKQKINNKN